MRNLNIQIFKKITVFVLAFFAIFFLFFLDFSAAVFVDVAGIFVDFLNVIGNAFKYIFIYTLAVFTTVYELTILSLKELIEQGTVKNLWVIVRDIVNLFITVFFIYVAMTYAFATDSFNGNTFKIKKIILGLILAAILVNFSAFITLFIVDIANIAAALFFTVGYDWIIALENSIDVPDNVEGNATLIATSLIRIVLYLALSVIFLAFSLGLIFRFILVLLALIISPIGIAGMCLTQFNEREKWLKYIEPCTTKYKSYLMAIIKIPVLLGAGMYITLNIVYNNFVTPISGDSGADIVVGIIKFLVIIACFLMILLYLWTIVAGTFVKIGGRVAFKGLKKLKGTAFGGKAIQRLQGVKNQTFGKIAETRLGQNKAVRAVGRGIIKTPRGIIKSAGFVKDNLGRVPGVNQDVVTGLYTDGTHIGPKGAARDLAGLGSKEGRKILAKIAKDSKLRGEGEREIEKLKSKIKTKETRLRDHESTPFKFIDPLEAGEHAARRNSLKDEIKELKNTLSKLSKPTDARSQAYGDSAKSSSESAKLAKDIEKAVRKVADKGGK